MRIAYADPPYPGLSKRYYEGEPSYAGEVDHVALIARLTSGEFDGWALSTSGKASVLRELLPLCPADVILCPWVKPHGVARATKGPHNAWEAVIVSPARREGPGLRDWLRAMPARGGGELMGRKPIVFCATLFRWLGMRPGDELIDLFPGTGAVGRAWGLLSAEASRAAAGDTSPLAGDDEGDMSPMEDA